MCADVPDVPDVGVVPEEWLRRMVACEGIWEDGVVNGEGIGRFDNGLEFHGSWSKGVPNGRGTLQ